MTRLVSLACMESLSGPRQSWATHCCTSTEQVVLAQACKPLGMTAEQSSHKENMLAHIVCEQPQDLAMLELPYLKHMLL